MLRLGSFVDETQRADAHQTIPIGPGRKQAVVRWPEHILCWWEHSLSLFKAAVRVDGHYSMASAFLYPHST